MRKLLNHNNARNEVIHYIVEDCKNNKPAQGLWSMLCGLDGTKGIPGDAAMHLYEFLSVVFYRSAAEAFLFGIENGEKTCWLANPDETVCMMINIVLLEKQQAFWPGQKNYKPHAYLHVVDSCEPTAAITKH